MSGLATRSPEGQKKDSQDKTAGALTGAEKGLLFLMSLDEGVATRILAQLTEEEVQRLKRATDTLQEVQPNVMMGVHIEFASKIKQGVPTSLRGSAAYLRRLAGKALGEGRIAELWEDNQEEPTGLAGSLAKLDPPALLAILERESPQTVAVVLAQLNAAKAAEILQRMDEEQQTQILLRLARMDSIPDAVFAEIEQQLQTEIASFGSISKRKVGGTSTAAALLKRVEPERSMGLIERIQGADSRVAIELQKAMFTFEDLLRINGRGMQVLLKEVETDKLVVALKTASDNLKELILSNMSSRAAGVLREELELLGPVKLAEVEAAQQAIVDAALALEKDGKISITREGNSGYV